MNYMSFTTVKQLLLIFFSLLAVDAVYIYFIHGAFGKMIYETQGSPMQLRGLGAFICYVALTILLYYFIVKEHRPALDAAILGMAVYAVYDSTNYATLKKWNGKIATIDAIWGGTLFYIVSTLVYQII